MNALSPRQPHSVLCGPEAGLKRLESLRQWRPVRRRSPPAHADTDHSAVADPYTIAFTLFGLIHAGIALFGLTVAMGVTLAGLGGLLWCSARAVDQRPASGRADVIRTVRIASRTPATGDGAFAPDS